MKVVENKFGTEEIYTMEDLKGRTKFYCAACMSVYADALSWANANKKKIASDALLADQVVILSCQVTDLAIYNDLFKARAYSGLVKAPIYISGCLAMRFDIDFPYRRLELPFMNYQKIKDKDLVYYEEPFWVDRNSVRGGFRPKAHRDGNLFRESYPLRIGSGCNKNCSYCTIRECRPYNMLDDYKKLEKEFTSVSKIVLISDNPTPDQILFWTVMAIKHNKKVSFRNVEPSVSTHPKCMEALKTLAENRLLDEFHSPIQSCDPEVLKDMNRSFSDANLLLALAHELGRKGVFTATNIIIHYKDFVQDFSAINKCFAYVSWNPYWDGHWNEEEGEIRWLRYINRKGVWRID